VAQVFNEIDGALGTTFFLKSLFLAAS